MTGKDSYPLQLATSAFDSCFMILMRFSVSPGILRTLLCPMLWLLMLQFQPGSATNRCGSSLRQSVEECRPALDERELP